VTVSCQNGCVDAVLKLFYLLTYPRIKNCVTYFKNMGHFSHKNQVANDVQKNNPKFLLESKHKWEIAALGKEL
jgi:hypothetical protein